MTRNYLLIQYIDEYLLVTFQFDYEFLLFNLFKIMNSNKKTNDQPKLHHLQRRSIAEGMACTGIIHGQLKEKKMF